VKDKPEPRTFTIQETSLLADPLNLLSWNLHITAIQWTFFNISDYYHVIVPNSG